jgi:single-strand DNA-binding protein
MNSVQLIGRLVKDGELRYNQIGTGIYRNTIAVNRKFKKDESDFISVVAFKQTGELMANHLKKGDQVGIEGHIQTGSYEKDGHKVYTTDIIVDSITFVGSKKQDKQPNKGYQKVEDPFGGASEINDSELPF